MATNRDCRRHLWPAFLTLSTSLAVVWPVLLTWAWRERVLNRAVVFLQTVATATFVCLTDRWHLRVARSEQIVKRVVVGTQQTLKSKKGRSTSQQWQCATKLGPFRICFSPQPPLSSWYSSSLILFQTLKEEIVLCYLLCSSVTEHVWVWRTSLPSSLIARTNLENRIYEGMSESSDLRKENSSLFTWNSHPRTHCSTLTSFSWQRFWCLVERNGCWKQRIWRSSVRSFQGSAERAGRFASVRVLLNSLLRQMREASAGKLLTGAGFHAAVQIITRMDLYEV